MMASNNITISLETRLCEVRGELGYFHTWEHYSKPMEDSQIFGIVEFSGGVRRVEPHHIKFCDEQNALLTEMAKHWKEKNDV